jgi:hypothetical protein
MQVRGMYTKAIDVETSLMYFLQAAEDLDNDRSVGFQLISTDDIDDLGIPEIIRRIRQRVGDTPVYLRQVPKKLLYK